MKFRLFRNSRLQKRQADINSGDPGEEVGHDERVVRERDGELFVMNLKYEIEMVEMSMGTLERDVYDRMEALSLSN